MPMILKEFDWAESLLLDFHKEAGLPTTSLRSSKLPRK